MATPKDFAQDGAYGASVSNPASAAAQPSAQNDSTGWSPIGDNPNYIGNNEQLASGGDASWTPEANLPNYVPGAGLGAPVTNTAPASAGQPTSAGTGYGGWSGGSDASSPSSVLGYMFDDGGSVPGGDFDDGDGDDDSQNSPTNAALQTVQQALDYGRQLHGLTGDNQQVAGNMPTAPASQSNSGIPSDRPFPRLSPTTNPFGKRGGSNGNNTADAGGAQMAANMPPVPASQSESGIPVQQPFPRLSPTTNPFGKRGGSNGNNTADANDQGIPDDEEAA